LAVVEERGGNRAQGVLHDDDADIAHVELDVAVVVEGARRGPGGSGSATGQGVQLADAVLIQVLGVREEQVACVNVFLDRLERKGPVR
jgi:hypothetical protein